MNKKPSSKLTVISHFSAKLPSLEAGIHDEVDHHPLGSKSMSEVTDLSFTIAQLLSENNPPLSSELNLI